MRPRRSRDRTLSTAALLGAAVLLALAGTATAEDQRARQRAALKAAAEAGEQVFRLLVVPVDFADARLPEGWDASELSARLVGGPGSVEHYWRTVSEGVLDLRAILAPTVRLPGVRRDYSDRDLGGTLVRSRAMATAVLQSTRASLPFSMADGDGDGELDGVLLLHAAPGLENDPTDGLIRPLQSWLLEPVPDRGVLGRRYAVASLQSGVGIWLHEIGHLLGLEDRYDLYQSGGEVDGEVVARGGLGVFSLMAAGYRTDGEGGRPALPDAYGRLELGWVEEIPYAAATEQLLGPAWEGPLRLDLDTDPVDPAGYYLLEVRGGGAHAPYDAILPEPRLLIYHVDEGVSEDGQSSSDPDNRHLRVRLVEADGDDLLARGIEYGDLSDVFPSDGVVQDWAPATSYGGVPSFEVDDIRPVGDGLTARLRLLPGRVDMRPRFTVAAGDTTLTVHVADAAGAGFERVRVVVLDGAGTLDGATSVELDLVGAEPGASVSAPALWTPAPGLAPGSVTRLALTPLPGGAPVSAGWTWGGLPATLDSWPTGWERDEGWQDWSAAAPAIPGVTLVASAAPGTSPDTWPEVHVGNRRAWTMASPPVPAGTPLALRHWFDLGPGPDGFRGDGAVLEYVDLAGQRRERAVPVHGYPGAVDPASTTGLAGDAAFAGVGWLDDLQRPAWRYDLLPGPSWDGDYRLLFRLESDLIYSGRGWLISGLEAAPAHRDDYYRPVLADGSWRWTAEGPSYVQFSGDSGRTWVTTALASANTYSEDDVARDLRGLGFSHAEMRILIEREDWLRITATVHVVAAGTGDPLRHLAAWPNPSRAGCRFHVDLNEGVEGRLGLYDLRGRLLRSWRLSGGERVIAWDGRDEAGRNLPAGRYLVRAETDVSQLTRSVTLLP